MSPGANFGAERDRLVMDRTDPTHREATDG
jgi:hypothetical protein